MDTPATESNQPQETSTQNDRLASLLKTEYGDDFQYEAEEPQGQPEAAQESPESSQGEGEPQQELQSQPETVDFETEGKQYKVPKELEPYLLRDRDYRHKTMELAEERKAIAAEKQSVAQATQAAQYVAPIIAQAQLIDAQLQRLDSSSDWNTLMQTDPLEFSNRQHLRRNLMDQRNALASQFTQATTALQQAQLAAHMEEVARNEPIVRKAIPNWGPETKKALFDGATNVYGYSPDELGMLADARHVLVLRDALEFRKLQSQRANTTKVVTAAPPANRPTAAKTPAVDVEYKKALDRLQRTGDPEDAVAVMRLKNKRR